MLQTLNFQQNFIWLEKNVAQIPCLGELPPESSLPGGVADVYIAFRATTQIPWNFFGV